MNSIYIIYIMQNVHICRNKTCIYGILMTFINDYEYVCGYVYVCIYTYIHIYIYNTHIAYIHIEINIYRGNRHAKI